MTTLFSTFGIDWHLLLAQVINFIVLATVLTWLLYKPVLKIVKERERVITKSVHDAEEITLRLSRTAEGILKRWAPADEEAGGIVQNARYAAADERAKLLKEAEERAARVVSDAEARAKEVSVKMLRDSEKEITRLAMLAAEKVLRV